MNNIEKYNIAFAESFSVDKDKISESLKYQEIEEWDSIGHMLLISSLEENFKISFETDDIVDFSSYKKGKEILKKYNIDF